MVRTISSCVLAVCATAAVYAQDTTIKTETRIKADDAKALTITGCLGGGPTTFSLSNVVAASAPGDKKDDRKTVGTSGLLDSYVLMPRDGIALAPHVGHRVELTGVVVPPATKNDDDAKIEVKERAQVQREDAPDSKTETTTKARIARGAEAQFAVASLKMISPVCIQ
jgi:hypothetical protein